MTFFNVSDIQNASRTIDEFDGFLVRPDGTCANNPDLITTTSGWALYVIGIIAAAAGASFTNFGTGTRQGMRDRLFTLYFCLQALIVLIARSTGTVIILMITQRKYNIWTEELMRAEAWVLILGLRPGTVMGVLQITQPLLQPLLHPVARRCLPNGRKAKYNPVDGGRQGDHKIDDSISWNAVAVSQILADTLLTWIGIAHIIKGELGTGRSITNNGSKGLLLGGTYMYIASLALILVLVPVFCVRHKNLDLFDKSFVRVYVCLCSIALCIAQFIMSIRGTQLCGEALSQMDVTGSVIQFVLSLIFMFVAACQC